MPHRAPFYTQDQVAEVLGISRSTLGRMYRQGKGPRRIRFRSVYRIPREEFETWLAEHWEDPSASDSAEG